GGRPTPKQLAAICRAASQIESIRTVELRGCPLKDRHFRDLSKLPALEYVDIGFTDVTDAGIRHLRNHRSLKVLDLTNNTKITDKGIAELRQLKDLKILVLSGTRISNAGLVHLKRLPALEYLAIDGTRIKTTSAQLLKMFPNVGSIAFD
ncbi:MAG: hypothetical protein ACE5KM_23015, partial [Planctomycetaceae bacterium]